MNVKVTRIDGHLAVVLPDDVAARLGAVEGSTLPLEEAAGSVILGHAADGIVRPEVIAAHRESVEQYGELYQKLADHEDRAFRPRSARSSTGSSPDTTRRSASSRSDRAALDYPRRGARHPPPLAHCGGRGRGRARRRSPRSGARATA